MIVTAFKAEHLLGMDIQAQQAGLRAALQLESLRTLEAHPSYSAFENGECVACAGVAPYWPGRYQAWAYISEPARRNRRTMAHVTRATKRFLDLFDAPRVELAVDEGFEAGHTWARHLGFRLETRRAEKYTVDGRDAAIYVRVR